MKNCRPTSREVRVQYHNPLTGELVARVPAQVCMGEDCGDVVTGDRLNRQGLCPCCAQRARMEKSA